MTTALSFIREVIRVLEALERDDTALVTAADVLHRARVRGSSVFIAGNGGSAATASHLANDLNKYAPGASGLTGRAWSLTDPISLLSALANDLSWDRVFSEQIAMHGRADDVVIALSTSGRSMNCVRALCVAAERGLDTIALTGAGGGELAPLANHWIGVPSSDTLVIESVHSVLAHALSEHLRAHAT